MSPNETGQAGRRKPGNPTLIREEIYRMNSIRFFETVWQDVRYAARTFVKGRAFTFVVIVSLALGIGANTVVFSLINTALLKMLPVKDPEQLVQFKSVTPALGPIGAALLDDMVPSAAASDDDILASQILSLEILWPERRMIPQRFTKIAPNQAIEIRQFSQQHTTLRRRPYHLGGAASKPRS